MKDRTHDEAMIEEFRANSAYAAQLLREVRRNGEPAELAILLRHIAEALGIHNTESSYLPHKWGALMPDEKLLEAVAESLRGQPRAGR